MKLEDRITYSSKECMQMLESFLDQLKVLQYDSKYRVLLGEEFCGGILHWEGEMRRRKEDALTIVVAGDFKRGKSTLINALLGEHVLTTDVTTETVTFNSLNYGRESTEAVLQGGKRLRLNAQELKKEKLEELIRQCGEPVTCLELKREIPFLKQITLIDTPGTGDVLKRFDDMVEKCLLQADVVIYVYSVWAPLSATEQMFLKSAILPQKFTSLYLVGNRTDMLESPQEYDRMKSFLEEKVQAIFPEGETYLVSALDELCREKGQPRPNPQMTQILEDNFQTLRNEIEQMIQEKKEMAVPDRMQRMCCAMVCDVTRQIQTMEQGLRMSREQIREENQRMAEKKEALQRELHTTQEEIRKRVLGMESEACLWMSEFLERIQQQMACLEHVEVEDIQKHLSFYCVDMLREGMSAALEYHRELLLDELENISPKLRREAAGLSDEEDYKFRFYLENYIWTKGDNMALTVSMLSNIGFFGGIVNLIGTGIAGVARDRKVKESRQELIQKVTEQIPEMKSSAMGAVSRSYKKLGERAVSQITYFYEEQLAQAEKAMSGMEELSSKEKKQKEKIQNALEEIKRIFEGIQNTTWLKR